MTHTHSTTKRRRFTHLIDIERGKLAAYIDEGMLSVINMDLAMKLRRSTKRIGKGNHSF